MEAFLTDIGSSLRCWAEVNLDALEHNLRLIRSALPKGVRYISVLKADAYGHGAIPAASRLMQAGVDAFAVANVQEAIQIREMGSGWPILILSPLLEQEYPAVITHQLIPTISSRKEALGYESLAKAHSKRISVHLKIDTGMGRSGVWYEEAADLYQKIRSCAHLELKGVYTHYSSADESLDYTELQRHRFSNLVDNWGLDRDQIWIHGDNSAGLASFKKGFNAVRIGMLQYGAKPYAKSLFEPILTQGVMSLFTRVILRKQLDAGIPVSYARTYTTQRKTQTAVLSAGYADAIPLSMSNRGQVLIHGHACPIIGRVTMDQSIVDVTDCAQPVQEGDLVTLIGRSGAHQIDVPTYSEWANDISWSTLVSISKRVHRIYRGNP